MEVPGIEIRLMSWESFLTPLMPAGICFCLIYTHILLLHILHCIPVSATHAATARTASFDDANRVLMQRRPLTPLSVY